MTDYVAGATIHGKFTTFRPSTGAPFTLAGTPAISVYKADSTTQSTSGVTLTVDFDTVTGLNHYTIDTSSDGTFYSAGSDFDIVVTTGTVDSVSAVGMVVGHFTIAKSAAYAKAVEVETDTQDIQTQIGTDGAGLTALPWNSAWDAEVQSEVTDALTAYAPALASDLATLQGTANDILTDTGTTLPATLATIAGYIDTEIATLQTSVNDLPTNAELATALSPLALEATLTTIDGLADAIKAKTDQLTFTGGYANANAKSMNDAPIAGTGTAGDLWRGV